MFHKLRSIHKYVGLFACLFLLVLSVTGFLLAVKGRMDWVRPETKQGAEVTSLAEIVGMQEVADAAFSAGFKELQKMEDIDRLEFHAEDRIFKVISKKGYREVQVDGATGKVLSTGQRNDQLLEDLHDLSFFADAAHSWGLPAVAVGLFVLSCSGLVMYLVPVARRAKFRRQHPDAGKKKPGP